VPGGTPIIPPRGQGRDVHSGTMEAAPLARRLATITPAL